MPEAREMKWTNSLLSSLKKFVGSAGSRDEIMIPRGRRGSALGPRTASPEISHPTLAFAGGYAGIASAGHLHHGSLIFHII